MQELKFEKKSSDIKVPDNLSDNEVKDGGKSFAPDMRVDEEAPLVASRLSHIGRMQPINHANGRWRVQERYS